MKENNNFSFKDIFKAKQYKQQWQEVQQELNDLKSTFTPEMRDVEKAQKVLNELTQHVDALNKQQTEKSKELDDIQTLLDEKQKQLIETDEKILLQEFGLYEPKYDFANSEKYKGELQKIRQSQKDMIKNGTATTGNVNWTVNGSKAQGNKMLKDMQKLLLRAFNSECDELINKVKYNTFDMSCKRITSSFEAISKLGKIMDVAITQQYYNSKIDELTLAFEYRQKQQEEKEQQKAIREQMREEAKLQKEIEAERKKIEKEQTHYKNALSLIEQQLITASEAEKTELLAKKNEIESQLLEIDKAMEDIDYREANQRAGYVYIISNIGSFGENVYKIGMTRRLDPMERVNELGDASVPFNFDVHAMIFSDDAPALENALHKAFEAKKVNMVNPRREFFNVTLDEIKDIVKKNFDKTVEFIDLADAEQFRLSQKMKCR